MSPANPVCDFCNGEPGPDAVALSAAHVMAGFRSGARPRPIMDMLTTMSSTFGLDVDREALFQNWLRSYRNDTTDWLLCPDCQQAWQAEQRQPTGPAGSAAGPRRRGWFARLFGR